MSYIQTATGAIRPEEIGMTLMHVHLLWEQSVYHSDMDRNDPESAIWFRKIRMEDLSLIWRNMHKHIDNTVQTDAEEAMEELRKYRTAGGHSILDLSCHGIGIYPETAKRIAEKTVLCHVDALCGDIPYLTRLLDRSVNLSFDQFGLEFPMYLGDFGFKKNSTLWLPRDIERVRCIARLCELGYSKQLVMSHDISFKVCYTKYGGNGYAHILKNIVPYLREEGVGERTVHQLLVENPARILSRDI